MCDFSRRLSCRIVNIVINNPSTTFWTGRIYCSYSSSKGKVRQRPSHQHHRRNEHNKHSFPELHTSKILSAQNLCAHLSGLRLTDVFSSGFRKSAAECTAVPVGFYPCTCLRFSNCRDSSVSTRLSDSHAPCIGSFLKYAGIISSILHPLTPVALCGLPLVTVYHSILHLSTLCQLFSEFRRFLQVAFILFVQNAFDYKCNYRTPSVSFPSAYVRIPCRKTAPFRGFCPLQFGEKLAILLT